MMRGTHPATHPRSGSVTNQLEKPDNLSREGTRPALKARACPASSPRSTRVGASPPTQQLSELQKGPRGSCTGGGAAPDSVSSSPLPLHARRPRASRPAANCSDPSRSRAAEEREPKLTSAAPAGSIAPARSGHDRDRRVSGVGLGPGAVSLLGTDEVGRCLSGEPRRLLHHLPFLDRSLALLHPLSGCRCRHPVALWELKSYRFPPARPRRFVTAERLDYEPHDALHAPRSVACWET